MMTKQGKIIFFLKVAVLLEAISTYIILEFFPKLSAGNPVSKYLYGVNPILIFGYVLIVVVLCDMFLGLCEEMEFEIEANTIVLIVALMSFGIAISNVMLMVG